MTRARTLSLLGNENNFTVTGSNNVGIGSTLPDGKLDVGGDILVGTAITLGNVSGIVSATDFYVNGVSITGAAGTWATFTSGGEGGISTTKKVKIENGLEVTGISTFSGNLNVGGVLTYADVTNVDAVGYATFRSGINVQGAGSTTTTLNVTGVSTLSGNVTIDGNLLLRDNDELNIGVGEDLKLYHNGTNSFIESTTGYLKQTANSGLFYVQSDNQVLITSHNAAENLAKFIKDGAVELYYDNSKKFETTATGTITTGIATVTEGLVLDGRNGSGKGLKLDLAGSGDYTIQETSTNDIVQFGGTGSSNFFVHNVSSGKVGIGSAIPTEILDVSGSGDMKMVVQTKDSGAGNNAGIRIATGDGYKWIFQVGDSTTSGGLRIYQETSGSSGERLRIRSGGAHVLVGTGGNATYNEMTESSSHSCVIIGSSSMGNGGLVIRTGTTGTGRIYFADNSGTDPGRNVGNIRYQHSDDTLRMTSGGSEAVVIDAGGNFNITGITTASQFDATSDVALKENIEVIDNPIVKLSELKGVTFDWKAGGHSVGVIAQDVEKVLPTAVGGSKDQKTVNYNAIIGLLVESVKDQQKQIEELKSLLDK